MSVDGEWIVADGFGAVVDAFRANFGADGDVGAACAVYVDGRPVVDVWDGSADEDGRRPGRRDTLVLVFSTTKGMTAAVANMCIDRGLLDVDAPVTRYWPEFAVAGKAEVTVGQLLSHQAGLPMAAEDRQFTPEEIVAWVPLA